MLLLCQFRSTNRYMKDWSDLNLRKEHFHIKTMFETTWFHEIFFKWEQIYLVFFSVKSLMSNVIKVQNLCYRNLHCEFYAFVRLPLINETIDFTEFELRKKSIVHSTKCGKNRSLLQYKIFRETNLLTPWYISENVDFKTQWQRKLCSFSVVTRHSVTLWKLRKFILTHFWQKFSESNGFTKAIAK